MREKGVKSLIFMPHGTLPLIFGLRQKFIYQNLAKSIMKLVQKSQIDRFEKKAFLIPDVGGMVWRNLLGWICTKLTVVAMPRTNPWE